MKYWKIAGTLLLLILLILAVQCVLVWNALSRLSALMEEEKPDLETVRERWDGLHGYLELSVPEESLEGIENDLALLERSEPEEREYELAKLRIRRQLKRIYDDFVPSFSGVF